MFCRGPGGQRQKGDGDVGIDSSLKDLLKILKVLGTVKVLFV